MERIGYLLSEIPVFIFVIWFTVRLVQYRRYRNNLPIATESDRRMLHGPIHRPSTLRFYAKFALAVITVTGVGYLQFVTLAPLGAGILGGTLLLTAATVVRRLLMNEI